MTFWQFLTNAWTGFVEYARNGSTHILNLIRAILYALMLFDVWQLTTEQMIALLAIAETMLQTVSAKTTVAAPKVEEKKQAAFDKGVAAGVAQASSGTGR